jgi:hypothetical protein
MPNSTSTFRSRKPAIRVLAVADLEQAKAAVLNSLTSASGQRTYDHAITEFVAWYCSEPRLAFNRTVVLRYRIHLEQRQYSPATINLRLAAVRRVKGDATPRGATGELADGRTESAPPSAEGSTVPSWPPRPRDGLPAAWLWAPTR